jgi:hypothetical protein
MAIRNKHGYAGSDTVKVDGPETHKILKDSSKTTSRDRSLVVLCLRQSSIHAVEAARQIQGIDRSSLWTVKSLSPAWLLCSRYLDHPSDGRPQSA